MYCHISAIKVQVLNRMSLDYALLGFLKQEAATGYELKTRCFSSKQVSLWQADQAQIYRTLTRLEERKLISSKRIRQDTRPDRITYALTPKGRERLQAWLVEPQSLSPLKDGAALQFLFSDELDEEHLRKLYESYRTEHSLRLSQLRNEIRRTEKDTSIDTHVRRARVDAFSYVAAQERAAIDCLDDAIERLDVLRKGA